MKRKLFLLVIVLAALSAGAYGYTSYRNSTGAGEPRESRFRFAKVERGRLRATITATGSLKPVTLVQVGSQVSGTIKELHADFNSIVRKGMVLARLDSAPRLAQVDQSRARLDKATATLTKRDAEIAVMQANLENAQAEAESVRATAEKDRVDVEEARREAARYIELFQEGIISASQRDSKLAARESAKAQHDSAVAKRAAAEARIKSLRNQLRVARAERTFVLAQIKEAEAELRLQETNLSYTVIRSPISGIVISRNVDVGQTVAASLQAPTLFTIAQDLITMLVEASVDEADVGLVSVGNEATFTVDAFPRREFKGRVREIRNAPREVQSVITYDTIIDVENEEGKLRPGMTANITIIVADRENVLKAPTEALAFIPPVLRFGGPGAERLRRIMERFPERFRDPKVWIFDPARGRPRPVPLRTGYADDTMTEIISESLREGSEVIVGVQRSPGGRGARRNRLSQFGRRLRRQRR